MARTSKILDKGVVDRIVRAVEQGATYTASASAGGIASSTLFAWLKQSELERIEGVESEYTAFAVRMAQANATAERAVTELWFGFCATDYRACRDFLSRRFPSRWGPAPIDESINWAPDDDEAAGALADAMETYLRNREADVT